MLNVIFLLRYYRLSIIIIDMKVSMCACIYIYIYNYVMSQHIMVYFTSQTKILFAKHFHARETILSTPLQRLRSSLLTIR